MCWIEVIKQISILLGIFVAIYGIDSWRREHTGKRKIELAEDVLALFYEASDAIRHMRHPASYSSETEDVEKSPNETASQYQARKNASIVFSRYNTHKELFNKLHAMRYRFMAQIGKEEAKPFDELREIVNEITLAARILSRLWHREHFQTQEERDRHFEKVEKYEAIFWDEMSDDDLINLKIGSVINKMELTCQKIISSEGSIYAIIHKKFFKDS